MTRFVEICDNRQQIKCIHERSRALLAQIPMDDTISHQYLIFLVCKTAALLVPSLSELQQIENVLRNYLKSSHVYIRCATINGILALLECCHRTSTSIGKLSDELQLLKNIALNYIQKHLLIDVNTERYLKYYQIF